MKVVHNIALSVGKKEKTSFANVGVFLQSGFTNFKMEEDDERWPDVAKLILLFNAVDTATTNFSNKELSDAKYFGVISEWHYGYPEPADSFGYLDKTFDQRDFCKICGTGLVQIAPFRLKKPPVWGNRSILQLNWVFDEYFVRPEVWEKTFKNFGIGKRPVLLDRTGAELESIVQLDIPKIVELKISCAHAKETCLSCGREKYRPPLIGFYPGPMALVEFSAFKSAQLFGSGARTYRLVMISTVLYRAIKSSGIKGVDFKPAFFSD